MEIPGYAIEAVNTAAEFFCRNLWMSIPGEDLLFQAMRPLLAGLESFRGVGLEWSREGGADDVWRLVYYFAEEPELNFDALIDIIFAEIRPEIRPLIRVTGEIRPLGVLAGESIGADYPDPNDRPEGSLGGVVSNAAGKTYYLSCNHVIYVNGEVCQHAGARNVLHPATTGIAVGQTVCDARFKLTSATQNVGDWALAEVTDVAAVQPWLPPGLLLVSGQPLAAADAVGQKVHKFGARTQHTFGEVFAPMQNFMVPYPTMQGSFTFKDQLRVRSLDPGRPFAEPGDSGALVVTEDGRAVGLVFGGDAVETFVCPLEPLFAQFQLRFVI